MNCPTCGSPVRVVGNTTKHYEPLCEFEDHKRKLDIAVKALQFYEEKRNYEPGSDWAWNGEDEVQVETRADIVNDEGDTAREALKQLGYQVASQSEKNT